MPGPLPAPPPFAPPLHALSQRQRVEALFHTSTCRNVTWGNVKFRCPGSFPALSQKSQVNPKESVCLRIPLRWLWCRWSFKLTREPSGLGEVWEFPARSRDKVSYSQALPPSQSSPLGFQPTVICLVDLQLLGSCSYQDLQFLATYGWIPRVRSWWKGLFQPANLKFSLKKQLVFQPRHLTVFPW